MAREIWVKIDSGKGLLPDGKPLPEPMLTLHQWVLVIFIWEQFHKALKLTGSDSAITKIDDNFLAVGRLFLQCLNIKK